MSQGGGGGDSLLNRPYERDEEFCKKLEQSHWLYKNLLNTQGLIIIFLKDETV